MAELKELFEVTTGQMYPPQLDPWKEQERRQVRARRTRRVGAIAVVAAIAIAIAVVAVITSRPDPTAPVPATDPPEPEAVFSWGDDLTKWVSEDEMTEAIADASALVEGQGPTGEAVYEEELSADGGSVWRAGDWSVSVHPGDHGGGYRRLPTETDPRLPEGVSYEAEWGYGAGGYILSGPNSEEIVGINLWWPGGPWGDDPVPEGVHEDMSFALASRLLQEIGWADRPAFDFSEDDLCGWLTAEDMDRIVTAAQERAGTEWPIGPFEHCKGGRAETDGYHWSWGPAGGHLSVNLDPEAGFDSMPLADHFSGHEMLDGSITYGDLEYLCSWLEIVRGQLRVEGHEDDVLSFQLSRKDPFASDCGGMDDAYEARVTSFGLAVADALLKEMNWVDRS